MASAAEKDNEASTPFAHQNHSHLTTAQPQSHPQSHPQSQEPMTLDRAAHRDAANRETERVAPSTTLPTQTPAVAASSAQSEGDVARPRTAPAAPATPAQQADGEDERQDCSEMAPIEISPKGLRPRTMTSTAEIDNTIIHPGSVRINVKGAFIVDGTESPPSTGADNNGTAATIGNRSPTTRETKGIRLPNHTAVVSHIAVDIGGSLAKLVYFSREAHSQEPGGRLNFISFETDRIDDCVAFMAHLKENQQTLNGSQPSELCVMATGGGAYKYYDKIREALGVDVLREDEMECLIIGLDFFITEIPREVFTYSETDPMHFASPSSSIYPYLLVNIGSGVSFLKVSGPRTYERVGGTSLGGGTLWGLLSLLTGARSFDEMLDNAERGDNSKVDMLVGDIYGTDYGKIGLKSTTIASSFGKVFKMKREAESEAEDSGGLHSYADERQQLQNGTNPITLSPSAGNAPKFSAPDISRSLLYAISNNIGQIAFLQSQIHSLSNIYFGGSFIRGHPQTMNTLSYAIKFWSKGEKQAYFLRHEGYLGAVGAFLKRQPRNWGRRGSFEELGGKSWVRREAERRKGQRDEEGAVV